MTFRLPRRTVLRALGGIGVGLPVLVIAEPDPRPGLGQQGEVPVLDPGFHEQAIPAARDRVGAAVGLVVDRDELDEPVRPAEDLLGAAEIGPGPRARPLPSPAESECLYGNRHDRGHGQVVGAPLQRAAGERDVAVLRAARGCRL